MQKITTHSKSGLFLMEMIFVLLFLGLTCSICVQLFAASYTARQKAREADHIQKLVTSTGEILEGTDCTVSSFLILMPNGIADNDTICYYFDKNWQDTAKENAVYTMTVTFSVSQTSKGADIRFSRLSGQNKEVQLYSQTIRYPVTGTAKEADS